MLDSNVIIYFIHDFKISPFSDSQFSFRANNMATGQLFSRNTQALFYNYKQLPIQRMLDFDFLCGESSFCCPYLNVVISFSLELLDLTVIFGVK